MDINNYEIFSFEDSKNFLGKYENDENSILKILFSINSEPEIIINNQPNYQESLSIGNYRRRSSMKNIKLYTIEKIGTISTLSSSILGRNL